MDKLGERLLVFGCLCWLFWGCCLTVVVYNQRITINSLIKEIEQIELECTVENKTWGDKNENP